ncbi:hypothetical protein RJ639_008687 [Escallonia herrerae]|uniref:Uncharacterized protein n=1 Tax=Escallonia herrerae TaxID=1293975 RepID=A0AA88VRV5_9ASTE|nr:hypothetical protein RJ639_008687 [Escallonia herrerae]
MVPEKQLHFMDIRACREELSLDLARELLIAISYSIPDKVLDCVSSERSNICNGVAVTEVDGADDLRSKLISISHNQSPDIGVIGCPCTGCDVLP